MSLLLTTKSREFERAFAVLPTAKSSSDPNVAPILVDALQRT